MTTSRELIDGALTTELLQRGIKLPAAASPSLAWIASDALSVLDELETAGVLVCGGDVWHRDPDGKITPAYANWYYEKTTEQVSKGDVRAAASQARSYITSLPPRNDRIVLFEIVCCGRSSP